MARKLERRMRKLDLSTPARTTEEIYQRLYFTLDTGRYLNFDEQSPRQLRTEQYIRLYCLVAKHALQIVYLAETKAVRM